VSPLFAAGEVLLGLSITMFVGALITTVSQSAWTMALMRGRRVRHARMVDWFNNRRLLEPIGNIPPAEAEERYYATLDEPARAA
jgi:hypothetical protein